LQGDLALGFWGWPQALTEGPLSACRAALQIRQLFELANEKANSVVKGFHAGIGIATGLAIAGRIGIRDHSKIGVVGPVVMVASHLEGLTKKKGVSILMDQETAGAVKVWLSSDEGRCRPTGRLRPAGFEQPIEVSELPDPAPESPLNRVVVSKERTVFGWKG